MLIQKFLLQLVGLVPELEAEDLFLGVDRVAHLRLHDRVAVDHGRDAVAVTLGGGTVGQAEHGGEGKEEAGIHVPEGHA